MRLKMSSGKCRPFWLGPNVLIRHAEALLSYEITKVSRRISSSSNVFPVYPSHGLSLIFPMRTDLFHQNNTKLHIIATWKPQSLATDMRRLFYSTWPPSFSSHIKKGEESDDGHRIKRALYIGIKRLCWKQTPFWRLIWGVIMVESHALDNIGLILCEPWWYCLYK